MVGLWFLEPCILVRVQVPQLDFLKYKYVLSEEHNKFRWVNKNNYHEVNDGTQYFEILEKYFSLEN